MNTRSSIRRSVNGPYNRANREHELDSKDLLQEKKSTAKPTGVVTKRNKRTDEDKEVPGVEGNSNRKGSTEMTEKRGSKRSQPTPKATEDNEGHVFLGTYSKGPVDHERLRDMENEFETCKSGMRAEICHYAAEKVCLELEVKRLQDERVALDRSKSAIAAALAEEMLKNVCIMCLHAPRDTLVFPCGDFHCCSQCADKILDDEKICPTCRGPTSGHIKLKGL